MKASRKPFKLRGLARAYLLRVSRVQHRNHMISTDAQPDLDMSLTMAQGMKRLGMPIAAFLGLALVGLIGTSWFLNRDALRQAVEAQIRAVTGLDLVVNGHDRRLGVSRQLRLVPRRRAEGRRHRRPGAAGRRADREFAAAAAAAAAVRDRRRHDAAAAYPCRPGRQWREQLDAVRRDHRARHEARRRKSGVVLGNPDPGRRAQLRGRRPTTSPRCSAISICRWPGRRSRARLPRPDNSTGAASASTARSAPAISSPMLSGDRSGLKARLASAPLETRLRRHGRQPHQPMMEGTVTIDSLSLRNALRWMGQAPPPAAASAASR